MNNRRSTLGMVYAVHFATLECDWHWSMPDFGSSFCGFSLTMLRTWVVWILLAVMRGWKFSRQCHNIWYRLLLRFLSYSLMKIKCEKRGLGRTYESEYLGLRKMISYQALFYAVLVGFLRARLLLCGLLTLCK
ncbi:hypothetical protein DM860_016751 [Cuscuta australis]|uniref:Transmembrane protein n=1 Tax=Cuscuta australis TaxID=267555 RepID=A0A328DAE7_9ASTE|nr:hypothetical protein DM860_016751 [Cuscuta australis]